MTIRTCAGIDPIDGSGPGRAHAGQVDEAGVDDLHLCTAVARHAAALGADELVATAWLHDTAERTDATADDLLAHGASERRLRVLRLLTHVGLEHHARLAAICADPDAALVERNSPPVGDAQVSRVGSGVITTFMAVSAARAVCIASTASPSA